MQEIVKNKKKKSTKKFQILYKTHLERLKIEMEKK